MLPTRTPGQHRWRVMMSDLALRVGAVRAIATNIQRRAAAVGDSDTFELADILLDNLLRFPTDDNAVVLSFPEGRRRDG